MIAFLYRENGHPIGEAQTYEEFLDKIARRDWGTYFWISFCNGNQDVSLLEASLLLTSKRTE